MRCRFVIALSSLLTLLPPVADSAPPPGNSPGGGLTVQGEGNNAQRMDGMGGSGDGMPMHGDPARGRKIAQGVCAGCHGPQGVSTSDDYPNLAGQGVMYIVSSLQAYRNKVRKVPMMNDIAAKLSGQDMGDVAAYYGSLAPAE